MTPSNEIISGYKGAIWCGYPSGLMNIYGDLENHKKNRNIYVRSWLIMTHSFRVNNYMFWYVNWNTRLTCKNIRHIL